MTVPSGLFAPGGRTGIARSASQGVIPIDWLEAHPACRRFMGHAERLNVGAAEVVDVCIDLDEGFEALLQRMVLTGKAPGGQGANAGTAWRLFFDRVPVYETIWQFGASVESTGRFDYLHEGDGLGNSWGKINVWVPQGTLVSVGINNNGGTADAMGWYIWGLYWPISLREEWTERGWRGKK